MDTPVALTVDIEKRLGEFHLQAQFSVGRELLVLFGHSGSGKSLTLRAIAGLLTPDSGTIAINGRPVFDADRRIDLSPLRRGVGLVVQNYALFPHMSVQENIAYGLTGSTKAQRRARVESLLALLDLAGLGTRRPQQLSGGQAQRVALARALAPQPQLLLLDEPFSALDSAIRTALRRDIARLKHELGLTIVFVTHDLREAYNLADQVAVFDQGRVLQIGPRDTVFNQPVAARIAQLTEVRNIWRGRVAARRAGAISVDTGRGSFNAFVADAEQHQPGSPVDICIRPERVILLRHERTGDEGASDTVLQAELVDEVPHGASHTLFFRFVGASSPTNSTDVEVDLPARPYEVLGVRGQRQWRLLFPREALHVMTSEDGPAEPLTGLSTPAARQRE